MKRLVWQKIIGPARSFQVARLRLHGQPAVGEHSQDFCEVFWMEEGVAVHQINGDEARLETGSMVFVRSTDRHGFRSADTAGFTIVNIAFPRSIVDALGRNYFRADRRWFWSRARHPDTVRVEVHQLRWLERWVKQLSAAPPVRLEIDLFLLHLLRELSATREQTHALDEPAWLTRVLTRVEEPGVMAGGTAGLARLAGRTPQHFNSAVKRFRRQTATSALNEGRMRYAMRELRTGSRDILEICLDCGLENLSHFYSLFRSAAGMTPKQYRKAHRNLLG